MKLAGTRVLDWCFRPGYSTQTEGTDLGGLLVVNNFDECRAACEANVDCEQIMFNFVDTMCFMKKGSSTVLLKPTEPGRGVQFSP